VLSARCSTLVGRAQLSNLLAERTFRPSDALPFPGADAVACELSREAIYWVLSAMRERASTGTQDPAAANSAPDDSTALATLWSETAPELLDQAAGGSEQAARVRADLLGKSFPAFAELGPDQQTALAARLHAFANRLIEPLAVPQRAQERAWVLRFQLLLATLIVLVGLGFIGKALKDRHDLTLDLAPSASWKASSQHAECSCQSPEQSCEACPNFFFHTLDDKQPSIVFDLHRVQALSAVVVENRRDCCAERSVPLVVQVSADQKHWKTVATRKNQFDTWRADFPTEEARWVKLYVARRDYLHLARVRLLP
jgi:F5/8 type C domain